MTTVQATQVFATLANGGVRVQPHVVAGFDRHGGQVQPGRPRRAQQVVSAQTADAVVADARGRCHGGHRRRRRRAWLPDRRQDRDRSGVRGRVEWSRSSPSFIGIAPADDPRIVVNVVVYDPQTVQYGGAVAAPVFSDVTAQALRYLGVPPGASTPSLYPTTYE